MNNIIKALLTISLPLGLLASCAQPNPHPMDMTVAVQSAKSSADHEALAAHYEQAAKDAEVKVEEHKKLLDQYKAHSYLYGRQALTIEAHCEGLLRSYRQIAEANAEMAKMHRQLAGGTQ
jgi:hypothetical protein